METPGRRTLRQLAAIFKAEPFRWLPMQFGSCSTPSRANCRPISCHQGTPLSWFLHGSLLERAARTPHAVDVTVAGRSSAINPTDFSEQVSWNGDLLSSGAKCNTPRRFDIGKVVQDLKECCHAILFASVGGRRDQIGVLRAAGRSMGAIARALGRAKATISRELQRNALPSGGYSPLHAASRPGPEVPALCRLRY
jgi:helix-turn-helix protein